MQRNKTITTLTEHTGSEGVPPGPIDAVRPLLISGALATGLAIVAVATAYAISLAIGAELLVAGPNEAIVEVTAGSIVGMTALGGTVAVALAGAAARWSSRPRATFVVTGLVGVLAYAVVPFAAAASIATALWLNVFHLAVAAPLAAVLGRQLPPSRAQAAA